MFRPAPLLDTLDELAEQAGEDGLEDLGHELLPRLVDAGEVREHRFDGYWRDVGTIPAYWDCHQELVGDDPPIDLDDPAWPVLTQATSDRASAQVLAGAAVESSLLAPGSRVAGTVRGSVVGRGARVEAGAVVRDSVLLPGSVVRAGRDGRARDPRRRRGGLRRRVGRRARRRHRARRPARDRGAGRPARRRRALPRPRGLAAAPRLGFPRWMRACTRGGSRSRSRAGASSTAPRSRCRPARSRRCWRRAAPARARCCGRACGSWRAEAGAITLDGTGIEDLDARSLRRRVGLVAQTPAMLPGSVADNLRHGVAGAGRRRAGRGARGRGPRPRRSPRARRARYPAASARGSRWPGRSRATRRCSCSTSRPPRWTPTAPRGSASTLRTLAGRGLGICVATHDLEFAGAWSEREERLA